METNLFNLTMNNIQKIGNASYVNVPLELCEIDERFQRKGKSIDNKAHNLALKWDWNKYDAIIVSVHWDTKTFSIINGSHRWKAAKEKNFESLPAKLINIDASESIDSRLKTEANIFRTQTDEVDTLSPIEKHKANIICNIEENVIVDKLCKAYDISLKSNNGRGRQKIGSLSGFTKALAIAKVYGEDMLNMSFYLVCKSRWNLSSDGFSANVLTTISNIIKLHPKESKRIIECLSKYFITIQPSKLFSDAYSKYPNRNEKERLTIFVEDYVVDKLGIDRVYYGGSITSDTDAVKKEIAKVKNNYSAEEFKAA